MHLVTTDTHAIKQQFQVKLRMACLAAPILVGPERVPLLRRKDVVQPETRQDDHSFAHPCNASKQCSHCRGRGGDPGGNGEASRRLCLPSVRKRMEQAVPPLGKID